MTPEQAVAHEVIQVDADSTNVNLVTTGGFAARQLLPLANGSIAFTPPGRSSRTISVLAGVPIAVKVASIQSTDVDVLVSF